MEHHHDRPTPSGSYDCGALLALAPAAPAGSALLSLLDGPPHSARLAFNSESAGSIASCPTTRPTRLCACRAGAVGGALLVPCGASTATWTTSNRACDANHS